MQTDCHRRKADLGLGQIVRALGRPDSASAFKCRPEALCPRETALPGRGGFSEEMNYLVESDAVVRADALRPNSALL